MAAPPSESERPKYGTSTATALIGQLRALYAIDKFDENAPSPAPNAIGCNDCLNIPHYGGNHHTGGGEQRSGVSQSIGPVHSYFDHVDRASDMPSPLGFSAPSRAMLNGPYD